MPNVRHVTSRKECNYKISIYSSNEHNEYILNNNIYNSIIVTTPTVLKLYRESVFEKVWGTDYLDRTYIIDCKEHNKSIKIVLDVLEYANKHQLTRDDTIYGVGGGNCTDIVTFAASLYLRGIKHVKIPTTLVGQIDAAIGVKGAVNHLNTKNMIGCYNPPERVYINTKFLSTLMDSHISDGIAEIIKCCVIASDKMFEQLESYNSRLICELKNQVLLGAYDIVVQTVEIMIEYLSHDIYEKKYTCRELDFGHTLSPMIESKSLYSISHGSAVGIDIAFSTSIAYYLGMISWGECSRILELLKQNMLPIWCEYLTLDNCYEAFESVKKRRGGALNYVVPRRIGEVAFIDDIKLLNRKIIEDSIELLKKKELGAKNV